MMKNAAGCRIAPDPRVLTRDIDRCIDPHVGAVGDAAAADDDRIARDVEDVRTGVVVVAQPRVAPRRTP